MSLRLNDDLPVTVIAGYLGSGKTTYINKKLNDSGGVRYAVLVNDFGELNIDAALIETEDKLTIALENGCVCCSLEGGLEQAAEQLRDMAEQIDWVLLEASGVAEPNRLQSRVAAWPDFELIETLTLIDATRIKNLVKDKFIGQHIQAQLSQSNQLQLTKTDLLSKAELTDLNAWLDTQRQTSHLLQTPLPQHQAERIHQTMPISRQSLEQWLNTLDENTLRLKGVLQLEENQNQAYVVQWVDKRWQIAELKIAKKPTEFGLIRITAASNCQQPLELPKTHVKSDL